MNYRLTKKEHDKFVFQCYVNRGYNAEESQKAAHISSLATYYGNQTHNALKALHLDSLFGSKVGGCTPQAKIEKKNNGFKAVEVWNANKKLGQAVAVDALERCMELADEFGVGVVGVDNAFHYLYGGAYVMEVAKKGYIVYTNCTSTLAEVVPFLGKTPTLGTNPHSWGFPTTDILGFPICIDWATSAIAMGRVQQLKREGKKIPADCAIDSLGNITQDPKEVASLLPFGKHKGYSLSLINELYGAYIGGNIPTIRGRFSGENKAKNSCTFFFQVIHPRALECSFEELKSQNENVKAVIDDIFKKGNEESLLPGELEYRAAKKSDEVKGLIFTEAEKLAFDELARENGLELLNFEELVCNEISK